MQLKGNAYRRIIPLSAKPTAHQGLSINRKREYNISIGVSPHFRPALWHARNYLLTEREDIAYLSVYYPIGVFY